MIVSSNGNPVMENPASGNREKRGSVLERLTRQVLSHPQDVNTLDQYYRLAVEQNQIDAAKNTISHLRHQFPENQHLIRTYIALCLYQQDYLSAIDSIETLVAISTPERGLIEAALKVREKIGPRKIDRQREAGATLSACLIVKDEQDYIGPCLQSIKAFADEIVVVDTGSTDWTGAIARIFGAKVYDYQWNDDFAEARNFGLDNASGHWVFIIDADEIISRKDGSEFLHFCRQLPEDERLGFIMTTLNYTNKRESAGWVENDFNYPEVQAEGWVPTEKVRLFPNHPNIRFVYPVHEIVDPVLEEHGYRLAQCPVPVLHFGKLNQNRKRERWQTYYRIGRKKLNDLGDHPSGLRELAIQAALLNRLEEASDLWRRFIRLRPDSFNGWTNLASIYSRLGRYRKASGAAHQAAQLAPHKMEALYNLVISELQVGDAANAIEASNRLSGRFPDYAQGHMLKGISHVCAGKWETGIKILKQARAKTNNRVFSQMIVEVSAPLRHAGRHDWIKDICSAIQQAT